MPEASRTGELAGVAGGVAGVAASLFVLFGPVVTVTSTDSDGTSTRSSVSGIDYLVGDPHAQVELLAWPVLLGAISIVGAVAAWRGYRVWTGAGAGTLGVFAVVGLFSIGMLYAPAAILLVIAALSLE